jgi:hypothetical protein
MNVLAWRFFFDLAFLDEKLNPTGTRSVENRNNALKLRREIYTHCVKEVDGNSVFAYAVPLDGEEVRYDPLNADRNVQQQIASGVYDDPMGSLLTMPYWGFCKYYDPIYDNTVKLLLSAQNPYANNGKNIEFAGAYHDSRAHGPFVASLANQLLVRINQQKIRDLVPELKLDNGIACESINCDTGMVETGHGMASMAGLWAYAMYRGLAKVSSFGWPEPTHDEIAKTEGAIRIAAIASGLPYPRPGGQNAVEEIGAMPRVAAAHERTTSHDRERPTGRERVAPRERSGTVQPRLRPPAPRVASRGDRAITRGQIDEMHSRANSVPDDIGNRLPAPRTGVRKPAQSFTVPDEDSDLGPI